MKLVSRNTTSKVVDGTTITVGMAVLDRDGNYLGKVKEIQKKGFLVERSIQHLDDLFIPYSVCLHDGAGSVKADIAMKEVRGS